MLFISFSPALSIFFKSEDFKSAVSNSEKAFLNPTSIARFLLKSFLKGFEISIFFISKALTSTLVVEKKK